MSTEKEKDYFIHSDLFELRGRIISDMILIERQLDRLIMLHFFDGMNYEFLKEVMGNNRMSFRNKIDLFCKIYNKPKLAHPLHELYNIRVDFAHYNIKHYNHYEEPKTLVTLDKPSIKPELEQIKKHTINELEKKYYSLHDVVYKELSGMESR